MQKFLLSASLAALLSFAGASISTLAAAAQSSPAQPSQQSKATKTVAGTVKSISNDGHAFGLEVNQNGGKQTMQFVVDRNAKIQGRITIGSAVTVEYAVESGQNMALTISGQG